ncbi:MAG: patatin-like phospholipase family protein [Pseudomonadota bacterium]
MPVSRLLVVLIRYRVFAAVLVAAATLITPAVAAEERSRPRIGLVLGGGGAAGVAHVGVIQGLEALGIRPDVIAGTSMGAIVGGLYAAGFSPEELQEAVTTIDWGSIFNDSSDRQLLHPLRRDSRIDPFSVQSDLPIGIGEGGIQIDAGLIDAVKLNLTLRRLFAREQGVSDFDDLPIPFRALATDIVTGEAVVLGQGDLTSAVRASMSIPALFPPVEIDGRLLVDGGVVNNLPVDVARAMGADILIVSEIPGAEVTPADLRSFTAVLAQTMSVMIAANSRPQVATLGEGDVYLVPDVQSVGMLAFEQAPSTVSAGRDVVAEQAAALRAIASGRGPLPQRSDIIDPLAAEIRFDRLDIAYDGKLDPRVIRARLDLPESGRVSVGALETALRRVYGLGTLDGVSYSTERVDGEDVLVVQAKPTASGRFQPRIGLGLSNLFGGDADFTIAFGFDANELNALGARLEFDSAIGVADGARLRFEQPLDYAQTLFLRPAASYFRQTGTLFAAIDEPFSQIEVSETQVGIDALYAPGNWGAMGAGVAYLNTKAEAERRLSPIGPEGRVNDDSVLLSFLFDYDTLDDPDLPRRGVQISTSLSFDLLDGLQPDLLEIDAVGALSFGQNTLSPFLQIEGDLDDETFSPNFIGGFQRLSGFEEGELIGEVVGVAGLRYYRRFTYDTLFGKEAFFGGSLEYGGAYSEWSDFGGEGSFVAGSFFGGIQTSFGPLILGFGTAEGGQYAATLTLGSRF